MNPSRLLQLVLANEYIVRLDPGGLSTGETLAWKHVVLRLVEPVLTTLPVLLPFITSVPPVTMNLWLRVNTHKLWVGPWTPLLSETTMLLSMPVKLATLSLG